MDQSDVQKEMYPRWSTNKIKVELSYRAYGVDTYNNTSTDC
jgi:hypothetical protein